MAKLWCTCNRPGHEIGKLLLYGIAQITSYAMAADECNSEDIQLVRETLAEGHAAVESLEVYKLFRPRLFTNDVFKFMPYCPREVQMSPSRTLSLASFGITNNVHRTCLRNSMVLL